uniref:Uncharacterized protein n=1 Tax=uncultured prokaryote TaxID=198431 RepID=A0A0H5PWL0_9ZZZZ|nr:hypothetical protein [uncultured prokaryote]
MPDLGAGAGLSNYAGVRVTLTASPASDTVWVAVSSKSPRGGWDQWASLLPAFRVQEVEAPSTPYEALVLTRNAIDEVLRRMDDCA